MKATAIKDALTVKRVEDAPNGSKCVVLDCSDYDAFRKSSHGIKYDGEAYGRTGWNSDRCEVYYNNRWKVASAR